MNDEPRYVMAEPPKIETPKTPINWHAILLQTLEVLGVCILAVGAGLYEPYLGFIVFGAYLVYASNS